MQQIIYGGFWLRLLANLIDTIWVIAVIAIVLYLIYGSQYLTSSKVAFSSISILMNYLFPIAAVILFWRYRAATPGKMILSLQIVDAKTFGTPTLQQFIIRYLGYFISTIPLCLGFLWIAFDKRKQGWHDKLAGTVVIRKN